MSEPSRLHGLSASEVHRRQQEFGTNEIEHRSRTRRLKLLLSQFQSPLIILLLLASSLAFVMGQTVDAAAILTIVGINVLIGYFQEYRAERAMEALFSLTARRARVLRDGQKVVIFAREIVPGDLLLLEAGDVVAADARLLECHQLMTNEAPLTGESASVEKSTEAPPERVSLPDKKNHIFMGTSVVAGTGIAEVDAIGFQTELGKIAQSVQKSRQPLTPMQRRLKTLARILIYACVLLVAIVAGIALLRGMHWQDVAMSSISLAVAVVPEGLAAVVTIALSIGMRRMADHHALIRRLSSVETLGSVTVICTDKTGTLTTGVMKLRDTWTNDPKQLFTTAVACCDAELADEKKGIGDPTELAILRAAAAKGIHRAAIERENPRVKEHPFSSEQRFMWVLRQDGTLSVKGAIEAVLPMCASGTEGAKDAAKAMALQGLRVLAVARGHGNQLNQLEFQGLLGIADPPREEAALAIADAKKAGIRIMMLTGDHPATAQAIAQELGIATKTAEIDHLVRARITAQEKNQIIEQLQAQGDIVAMTGDGVNDAPAVRNADVGIAMGEGATEVTREASDIVLTDNNLASVITAVRQGRIIYQNIQKTVGYLLSGNLSELFVMLTAAIAGLPFPLLPLHLLWINLINEPLPGIALVCDTPSEDVLNQAPRPPKEPLIPRPLWVKIITVGILHCTVSFTIFLWALETQGLAEARSLCFSTLVFSVLLRALSVRSSHRPFWEINFRRNLPLLLVIATLVGVQFLIYSIPFTRTLMHIHLTTYKDLGIAFACALIPLFIVEIGKVLQRFWPFQQPTKADPLP